VFLGGTDTHNVTGLVLQALSERDLLHLHVDVVVGTNNSHRRDIEGQATARGNTTVHGPAPHLADLLSRADLAIGAGGATTWERMCLGVPTVLISIAENQQPSSEALARAQLVSYAGHLGEVSAALVAEEIRKLLKARRELIDTSVRNQLVVDGLGTPRIVEVLYPTAEHHLRVRGARGDDIVLFYNWANDAAVRANAFNTDPIAWTTHEAWFSRKLRSSDSHLFVLEANGLPIGQIRFDMEDGEARIDYSLDEFVRGRGWGARLLALGMDAMRTRKPTRFKACVKGQNVPSRSAFVRLGFTLDRLSSADRLIFYKDAENAENRRAG
jgi:RimJ/RimL family protein N-acetyltransferase